MATQLKNGDSEITTFLVGTPFTRELLITALYSGQALTVVMRPDRDNELKAHGQDHQGRVRIFTLL